MYVIRFADAQAAIDPVRRLVKIADPNAWKAPWPQGTEAWRMGHELRNDAIGISIFTSGAKQKLHYHEKTWELYQVLEGSLRIAVKPYRSGNWEVVILDRLDMVLLAPGTLHLVDEGGRHVTQVIQTPPALSDQREVTGEDEFHAKAALASEVKLAPNLS
jgi:hypothetical protein